MPKPETMNSFYNAMQINGVEIYDVNNAFFIPINM